MVHNRDSVWIWVGVGLVPEVHDPFGPFSPFLLPLCPGTRVILAWITSSAKKVWATGAGSANPVVSMMTPSSLWPSRVVFFKMLRRPWMRSPLTSCSCSPQRGSTKSIETPQVFWRFLKCATLLWQIVTSCCATNAAVVHLDDLFGSEVFSPSDQFVVNSNFAKFVFDYCKALPVCFLRKHKNNVWHKLSLDLTCCALSDMLDEYVLYHYCASCSG